MGDRSLVAAYWRASPAPLHRCITLAKRVLLALSRFDDLGRLLCLAEGRYGTDAQAPLHLGATDLVAVSLVPLRENTFSYERISQNGLQYQLLKGIVRETPTCWGFVTSQALMAALHRPAKQAFVGTSRNINPVGLGQLFLPATTSGHHTPGTIFTMDGASPLAITPEFVQAAKRYEDPRHHGGADALA